MSLLAGRNAADLIGLRFGMLTVLGRDVNARHRRTFWRCRCDCGLIVVKMGKYLSNGDTQSCGCAQRQHRATGRITHGNARGHSLTREYKAWRGAKERCYNSKKQNYRYYGALGVRMADAWLNDFAAFLRDMGPCPEGLTLDRIDPHGHYEPGNCRWAPWSVQYVNKRRATRPSYSQTA